MDSQINTQPDYLLDETVKELEISPVLKTFLTELRQEIYAESSGLVMLEPLSEAMLQHTFNRGKLAILNILLDTL
jgi:hypothetical protein